MTNPYISNQSGAESIADLIRKLKDPDKQKRELLLRALTADPSAAAKLNAQYGDNPKALEVLTGQAPRFGFRGKGDYQNVLDLIKNAKPDAETQANKFKTNELNSLLGLQALNNPNIADASQRVDMSNVTPGLINNYDQAALQRYQEAQATAPSGRIETLTPQQRLQQSASLAATGAQTEAAKANTAESNARTDQTRAEIAQKAADKASEDANDKQAQVEFAKWGTGPGLVKAMRDKKVSLEGITAIQNYKKGAGGKIVDDARDQWYKEQLLEIDRNRSSHKFNIEEALKQANVAQAKNISEKLNGRVSAEQTYGMLEQLQKNPTLRDQLSAMPEPPQDPQGAAAWAVNNEINNFKTKLKPQDYAKAYLDFRKSADPIIENIRTGKIVEEQIPQAIQDINALSYGVFTPYNITPLKYAPNSVRKGIIFKNNIPTPEVVDGDPELLKAAGIKLPPAQQKVPRSASPQGLGKDSAPDSIVTSLPYDAIASRADASKSTPQEVSDAIKSQLPNLSPVQLKAIVDSVQSRRKNK